MKIIKPSVELLNSYDYDTMKSVIERAGRVCYKNEGRITDDSAEPFIKSIIGRGHLSVLEHASITVKAICDRGVSHELVRHRIASYSQESTRYCNYSKDMNKGEITVIEPCFFGLGVDVDGRNTDLMYDSWRHACRCCEIEYLYLIKNGATPQEARSVLPNSLKTEIVITMNIREWRHFIKLRSSKAAHPQMREISDMIKDMFIERFPVFFEDLKEVE